MPWLAPVIAAVAPVVTGAIGNEQARGARESQEKQAKAGLAALQNIQLPEIEQQKLLLELPQLLSQYNPQMEQAQSLGPSAMESIQVTPAFEEAQLGALQALQERGEEGLTASEKAVLNQIRRSSGQQEHAQEGAIMQNMAQRGIGGSGLELASRLSSSQAAADRASQESDREAAMIQERQLAAIKEAGAQAGQLRGQEFGEKSDVSKAKDFINQFNLQNTQNVQQRNVTSSNLAQMHNQTEAQRIAEQQAALKNQEQSYNKGLLQQEFSNKMAKATGQQQPSQQLGNLYGQQAAETGKMWGDIGSSVAKGVAGLGQAGTFATKTPEDVDKDGTLAAIKKGLGQ